MRETPLLNILVVDKSVTDAETLADALRRNGYVINVQHAVDLNDCRQNLQSSDAHYDIVFVHYDNEHMPLPSFLASQLFQKLNVVVLLDNYHRQTAATLIHLGAYDVVAVGERELLKTCVERLLQHNQCNQDLATSYRTFNEDNQRLRWLCDHITQPLAYLHQGIFVFSNPAFDTKFGRPSFGETTIFELVDTTEASRLKSILHNPLLSSIDTPVQLRFSKPRTETCSVLLKNGIFEHEPCVQLLFSIENNTSPAAPVAETTANTLDGNEDFFGALQDYLAKTDTREIRGWIAALDVDQYQALKRSAGLSVIKKTMHELTTFLQKQLNEGERIVYLGQSSYFLFIPNESSEFAKTTCEKLLGEIRQKPFQIGKKAVELSLSIGLAALYGNMTNIDTVLSVAENACGIAQKTGGDKLYLYDPQRDAHLTVAQETNWSRRIEEALAYNLFYLLFQPIASLHANAEERYEVLVRLKEKDKEVVPQRFLPAIQQTSLPIKIDKWVIENTVKKWQELRAKKRQLQFFVKLSDAALVETEFLSWLEKTEKIPAEVRPHITFQIELNAIMALEQKAKTFIRRVNELGYTTAAEHCNASQNSLAIMAAVDVSYIKIDGKVIHLLGRDRIKQQLLHAIADVGKKTNKQLIATNVQDADSLAVLWQEGVHLIQGFYVRKPSQDIDFDFGV